jgi:hypothetical protein
MYITTQYQLQLIGYISELYEHITQETAICHTYQKAVLLQTEKT